MSIGVEFDVLDESPLVGLEELSKPPLNGLASWTPQSSGVELPPFVAATLDAIWTARTSSRRGADLSRDPPSELYTEGAVRRITVNAYERDPRARHTCVLHHGTRCAVCAMSFAERYGREFDGFIHVHHLRPLSEVGREYQVDPIKDLRPVCPNCHAALHHNRVPYSIEELRDRLARQADSA